MNLLKLYMILVLSFANLLPFAQEKTIFYGKDSIRISGTVIGYTPTGDHNYIGFSTYNLTGKNTKHSIQVNTDGTFDLKLYQAFEGNIDFSFRDAYKSLYVIPGQHIQLEILRDKLNRETNHKDAFLVKGKLAEINNLLFAFESAFNKYAFQTKADFSDISQTDSVYAAKRMQLLSEQLDFLDTFLNRKNINNTTFKLWQRNQLIYAAANEVLFYPFAGKLNKSISERQLLSFIKNVPINNESALHSSSYYSFLNMLIGDEQIIININPEYDEIKKINGHSPIPLYLDKLDALSTGLTRQLMYYILYSSTQMNPGSVEPFYDRISSAITYPYLKQLLERSKKSRAEGFKPYDLVERIKNANINEKLTQNLLRKLKSGTAFYIDFWGDWCAPCMSEMPKYPNLIAALEGKPIQFIFFSVSTSQNSMLAVKEKFAIKGDFINLNDDEAAIMNNIFGFHSYPSHFLVDRTGKVVTNQLSSIANSSGIEHVKKIILSTLKWEAQ